jgi:hypothetical protein
VPFNSGALILKWQFVVALFEEVAETQVSLSGGPGFATTTAFGEWNSDDLQDCADLYGALMGSTGLYWGSYSTLKSMKLAAVGTGGEYLAEPLTLDLGSGWQGASAHVPPQDTVVLSLRSGYHLGTANYGRMYLPHTIMPLQSGQAHASSSDVAALTLSAKTFLDAINDKASGKSHPSKLVIRSSKGAGSTKAVAEVKVGNIIDTQMRRRNALTETYSSQTLVVV